MTFRRRVSWTIYTTGGKDRSELLQLYSFRVAITINTYIALYMIRVNQGRLSSKKRSTLGTKEAYNCCHCPNSKHLHVFFNQVFDSKAKKSLEKSWVIWPPIDFNMNKLHFSKVFHGLSIILSKNLSNEKNTLCFQRNDITIIIDFSIQNYIFSWRQQKHQCLFSLLRLSDELFDVIIDAS